MARDTQAAAGQNAKTAQGLSSSYSSQAQGNSNILTPTLNKMVTSPTGLGQQTKNNMTTAAMQTAGGAEAGIVGGALQRAAATNNAGAYDPAIASAGQDAMHTLSDAALGVENTDALLKEQQRQQGIEGLQNMYGTNVGAGQNSLGLSDQALQTQLQAGQSGWLQNTLGVISALNGSNGGAASTAIRKYCWIAAEAFGGWDDPRTQTVRNWLATKVEPTYLGSKIVALYSRYGERVARTMRQSTLVKALFSVIARGALILAESSRRKPVRQFPNRASIMRTGSGRALLRSAQ